MCVHVEYRLDINDRPANLLTYEMIDRPEHASIEAAVPHGLSHRDNNTLSLSERVSVQERQRERKRKRCGVVALCTSDGNQPSDRPSVRERIERRAAERISHSARCEPRLHRGARSFFFSFFFSLSLSFSPPFLYDFVCGRAERAERHAALPFLAFLSMTGGVFLLRAVRSFVPPPPPAPTSFFLFVGPAVLSSSSSSS